MELCGEGRSRGEATDGDGVGVDVETNQGGLRAWYY